MKNNKLIAEFMGYKLMSCNRGKAWDIGKSIPSKDHLFAIQGVLHTGNELKFHTSWDWLMPVIEKCLVREAEQNEEVSNTTIKNIYEGICNQNISFAYKSVLQFINQLNKGEIK
jgi:hypothetical protein